MVISEELLRPKDITVNIAFHYGILGKSFGLEQLLPTNLKCSFLLGFQIGHFKVGDTPTQKIPLPQPRPPTHKYAKMCPLLARLTQ